MRLEPRALYTSSLIIAAMFIGVAFKMVEAEKVQAKDIIPIPLGGQIATTQMCCNGLQITLTGQYQSPALGTFIFEWYKMTPQPTIGWGLYSWWMPVSGEKTVGNATPGGVCQSISSECSTTPVMYSINQMGTTLITGSI
jgi:hypothetical protein